MGRMRSATWTEVGVDPVEADSPADAGCRLGGGERGALAVGVGDWVTGPKGERARIVCPAPAPPGEGLGKDDRGRADAGVDGRGVEATNDGGPEPTLVIGRGRDKPKAPPVPTPAPAPIPPPPPPPELPLELKPNADDRRGAVIGGMKL